MNKLNSIYIITLLFALIVNVSLANAWGLLPSTPIINNLGSSTNSTNYSFDGYNKTSELYSYFSNTSSNISLPIPADNISSGTFRGNYSLVSEINDDGNSNTFLIDTDKTISTLGTNLFALNNFGSRKLTIDANGQLAMGDLGTALGWVSMPTSDSQLGLSMIGIDNPDLLGDVSVTDGLRMRLRTIHDNTNRATFSIYPNQFYVETFGDMNRETEYDTSILPNIAILDVNIGDPNFIKYRFGAKPLNETYRAGYDKIALFGFESDYSLLSEGDKIINIYANIVSQFVELNDSPYLQFEKDSINIFNISMGGDTFTNGSMTSNALCLNASCKSDWSQITESDPIWSAEKGGYLQLTNLESYKYINETEVNTSIDAKLSTTLYFVNQTETKTGTNSGNNNLRNLSYIDGNLFNITESAVVPGYDVRMNFSINGNNFTSIHFFTQYYTPTPTTTHYIEVRFKNCNTLNFVSYGNIVRTDNLITYSFPIEDGYNYICNGIVEIQLYHPQEGTNTHKLIIDEMTLRKGLEVIGSSSFSDNSKLDKIDQRYNESRTASDANITAKIANDTANRALTDSYNANFTNITAINITSTDAYIGGSKVCTQATGCGASSLTPNFYRLEDDRTTSSNTTWLTLDELNITTIAGYTNTIRCDLIVSAQAATTAISFNISYTGISNRNQSVMEIYTSTTAQAYAWATIANDRTNPAVFIGTASGGAVPTYTRLYGYMNSTNAGQYLIKVRPEISGSAINIHYGSNCVNMVK
jgi:hypothetical protein